MSVTYGYTVTWRERGGAKVSVSVNGCSSINDAVVESIEAAKRLGYRRPNWRQIVRWVSEPDYEKILAKGEP